MFPGLFALVAEIQREVDLLLPVLTHPAGFNVDLFGNLLGVNGTEGRDVWEVAWDRTHGDGHREHGHRSFKTAREAVRFFCVERRRLQLGLEFERIHSSARQDMEKVVSPHGTEPWIADLSRDRRICKLLGYHCVADFDITPVALAPLVWEILEKLIEPELSLRAGECATINIGLYQGGTDIRVWRVWFR